MLEKYKMKSILYVMLIVGHTVVGHTGKQCCEPGRYLLRGKTTCWEPSSNTTVKVGLKCNETVKIQASYTIDAEGTISIKYSTEYLSQEIKLENGTYCVGKQTTLKDINLTATEDAIVVCAASEDDDEVVEDHAKAYCMIVSVVFLYLTAAVYASLFELRDLLGKSIINFCASMATGLMILSIMKLMEYTNMTSCAIRGFLGYFFIIASFFWMNAISIQILLSMRKPYLLVDRRWKEFLWYALYAWGCPAALTICMAIVNFHPGDHPKPGIGLMHCWFFGNQHWYYLYSVMSILIVANIIIFTWILPQLWCQHFNSSNIKALKYKCSMSVRLFILMGITWVFEMIGSLFDNHIIWTILDIYNTLQGLFIFILLVLLRRRVLKLMLKHGWLFCVSGYVEKHLALVDDAEDIAEHTIDMGFDDNKVTSG